MAFVALYRGDAAGVFAITPIVNYLLASLGFLRLFCWAALHGMFHDIGPTARFGPVESIWTPMVSNYKVD